MTKSIFYLAKANFGALGVSIFRKPPIKLFRTRDANVCWSGGEGEGGRLVAYIYALGKLIPILDVPQATCMEVEIESEEGETVIRVIDKSVDCEVSYY